ncbi:vesicular inhibitory amino acid transporter [Ischnura elegans]|uniref:vesicular inhibitory amino acid transporter n=1 Tax=Ischnura elegans TaxID=197161 RepID=UPI001ED8AB57|nr:vesicular inhibitory amino acid transporter [Ischnura elegans]
MGEGGPRRGFSVDDCSHGIEGGRPGEGKYKITEWQAAWNVTNAIQGMFIVSLPFAVLRGGYWAIAAMVGVAHICCYTGKILVDCLYEDMEVDADDQWPNGAAPPPEGPPAYAETGDVQGAEVQSWEGNNWGQQQQSDQWGSAGDQTGGWGDEQGTTGQYGGGNPFTGPSTATTSHPTNPFLADGVPPARPPPPSVPLAQQQDQQDQQQPGIAAGGGVVRRTCQEKRMVKVRVRDSYVGIAREVFGPLWGVRFVNAAQIIELLMTCILYVVVVGDLMIGAFPPTATTTQAQPEDDSGGAVVVVVRTGGGMDTRSWMLACGILLVPLAFLKSLHAVSMLSFWCTIVHLVINAVILGYCLLQIGDWGWGKVKWTLDLKNFPISLGVIVFSYTSQIFLPTLEGSLEDPSTFSRMLSRSHVAAALFKSFFGYFCFLTFQDDTQQVITNNLHSQGFKGLVNFFLVVKALLSYPLPYYAACELLEKSFFKERPTTLFPSIWEKDGELKVWGLAFRVGVVVFTVLLAVSVPHFAILMGFIGSFTGTMLSFIWPCVFHLKLKRGTLSQSTVAYDWFVIALGCLFGVIGVWDSGSALIRAFEIGLPF